MRASLDVYSAQKRFQKVFAAIMAGAKKDSKTLFMQQVRGVISNCLAVTPPMGGSRPSFRKTDPSLQTKRRYVDFAGPKRTSKIRIESDVSKATSNSRAEEAKRQFPTLESAIQWYRGTQNARKRPKIRDWPMPGTIRRQLKKHQLNNQGWTASGWNEAVNLFGVRGVPAWITKHKSSGNHAFIDLEGTTLYMEAVNGTNHPASSSVKRMIAYGIAMQARSMERWLKNWNEKKAAQQLRSS
jgi:hypothetical protein